MTRSSPSFSRQILVAVLSAMCAFAASACSNTATSTAVQPLSKHGVSAQNINWTFYQVDDTGSYNVVTGINDADHIVGKYSEHPTTTLYKLVNNSYIGIPQAPGSYTFHNDNYPNAVESAITALSPKGPGYSSSVEAGWLREPGHLNKYAPYPPFGVVNNQGLWTVMHMHPGEDSCDPPNQAMELSAINDGQTAVGFYTEHSQGCADEALEVSIGEQYTEITPSGYYSAAAGGINDSGHVVGTGMMIKSGPTFAWYLPSGTDTAGVKTLSGLPGVPMPQISINSSEVIAGSYTESGATHGFICDWDKNSNPTCSSYQTVPNPCGGCGGAADDTIVYGINDSEDICGSYVTSDGHQHGFVGIAQPGRLRRRAVQSHSARSLQSYSTAPSH